ncbi:MAG: hypothetical protein ACREA5_06745 [Nitrosotalea sp.]
MVAILKSRYEIKESFSENQEILQHHHRNKKNGEASLVGPLQESSYLPGQDAD